MAQTRIDVLIGSLAAFASHLSWGAETTNILTLNEAIEQGLKNSPTVQKAEALSQEGAARRLGAYSGFLPKIDLSGSYFFSKRYQFIDLDMGNGPTHFPQLFPTSAATVSASLPIFDGLANWDRFKAASSAAESVESEYGWERFQVEEEIGLKYAQAIAATELKLVADQNLQTIKDHLEQTQKLKQGGVATQYDVLRVEVQLSEATSELLKAQDDGVIARRYLAEAMGMSDDSREIQGELEKPDSARVQAVRDLKIENFSGRKDIESLSKKAEATEAFRSAQSKYWVPKVSLGANYTWYNNLDDSVTTWDRYRTAWMAGVFLNWNLFDGLNSVAQADQERARAVIAEKSLEKAKIRAPIDFDFWKRRYLYSAALYNSKRAEVEKALESVRLSKASYKAGVRTNSEILDAELDLFRARAGVVLAQINCLEARTKLELAIGRKI